MDNATSNDVLARSLATLLIKYNVEFDPKSGQIRCLPHVINLVVQQILSKLSSGDVADLDVDDYYNEAKKHLVHYDPNNDPDVQELEDEYLDDENGVNSRTDSSDEEELSDDDSDSELHAVSQRKAPIAKVRLDAPPFGGLLYMFLMRDTPNSFVTSSRRLYQVLNDDILSANKSRSSIKISS